MRELTISEEEFDKLIEGILNYSAHVQEPYNPVEMVDRMKRGELREFLNPLKTFEGVDQSVVKDRLERVMDAYIWCNASASIEFFKSALGLEHTDHELYIYYSNMGKWAKEFYVNLTIVKDIVVEVLA
jgi:hypothetical protein